MFQDGDHYILKKLGRELLPWMVSGKKVRRRWFVWAAMVHNYTNDLAAALAGLGIGAPLVALAQEKIEGKQDALSTLREVLPAAWIYAGVAALVIVILFSR